MIDYIVYALLVAAAFQHSNNRYVVGSIFAVITLLHNLLFSHLDGLIYYGSAAAFDIVIILFLSGITPICELSLRLIKVSVISVIANAVGWVMWMLYLPPTAYNNFYLVLYSYVLIIMMRQTSVGNHALDSRFINFRFPHH